MKNFKIILIILILLPLAFMLASCKKKNNKSDDNGNTSEVVTYTVSYELNGGVNNANNPTSYTSGNQAISLLEPSKDEYSFDGWYLEATFENLVTQIDANSTGNKTFYAKWSPVEYEITYVLLGGDNNPNNPIKYTAEDEFELLDPVFEGVAFDGWYVDQSFMVRATNIARGTRGQKTYYAKWIYNIVYELYGGTNNANNPSTYTYSNNVIDLYKPTRSGYKFVDWYLDTNFEFGSEVDKIEPRKTGNVKLYAKWEAIKYSIQYELNGGDNNSLNPTSYTVETEFVDLKEPSRLGYDFDGWYTEESFDNKITRIDTKTQNTVVLYAKWTEKTLKIYFNYNGATANNDIEFVEVVFNSAIGELPVPEKTDFVFMGWWRNNIKYTDSSIVNFNQDITFEALWIPYEETILYTVDFDSNGGSEVASQTDIAFGEFVDVPSEPTKSGYSFDGWYLNDNQWNFEVNQVNSNITLVAKWSLVDYEIEYILNDGENNENNPATYNFETEVELLDPTREGYDFTGWYLDENLNQKIEKIELETTGKVTVYAGWKKSLITKSTADITVHYNLPEQLASLYTDYVTTISVYEIYPLTNFNNTNLGKYFLGYSYVNYDDVLVQLEDNFYNPDSSFDITINASWDTEALLNYYYTDGLAFGILNNKAFISNYSGSSNNVYIPKYYSEDGKDYLVSSIGESAFESNIFISKIVFLDRQNIENDIDEENLVTISANAFKSSSISSFDFTYISEINSSAFINSSLKTLVTNKCLKSLSESAFENCLKLESVDLSSISMLCTYLPSRVFYGCTKLSDVRLAIHIATINNYAFAHCTNLTNLDFLKDASSQLSLKDYVFKNCTGLDDFKLFSNISEFGLDVFENCNINTIELTRLYYSIGSTFINTYGILGIKKITVSGENITTIPIDYFANLTELTEFVMSDYVTIIEDKAFKNCSNLADITLSKNLKLASFTMNSFVGTYWLSQLTEMVVIETTLVYVPNTEELTELNIEEGVTAVSQSACANNQHITKVTFPSTIEIISNSAFKNCQYLETVEFAENSNLVEISDSAFERCIRVAKFSLENCSKLELIGSQAFSRLGLFAEIDDYYLGGESGFVLPNSLKKIKSGAFNEANIYTFVANGEYIATDENGILYELTDGVKTAIIFAPSSLDIYFYKISETIETILDYAFYYCYTSFIYIDNSVTIGTNAFWYSTVLVKESVKIEYLNSNSNYDLFYLSQLTENYNYELVDEEYNFTVTEEVDEGYYYVLINEKVFLIRVDINNDEEQEHVVGRVVDITEYYEYL